jgi:hypothetical protein
VDENSLTVVDRATETFHGTVEVEHQARVVELIEAGAEIDLRAIDVREAACCEQAAERFRKVQLVLQSSDGRRIGGRRDDPPMLGSGARGGCGHARKLGLPYVTNKHHSPAYRSTPHPSHTSVAPLFVIALRRCRGSTVSQWAHE